jgi:hypothetical protein
MKHCSEDDLILHYYGERRWSAPARQRHLDACPACAAAFAELTAMLQAVSAAEPPPRDESYGLEVWHRIRHRLPDQEQGWFIGWTSSARLFAAAATVVLLIAAGFIAGRSWPAPGAPSPVVTQAVSDGISPDAAERVRLAAIADHFERSEHILLDVVTAASATADVSDQQIWAADLLTANRLYRDASLTAGDDPVVGVLDELERALLELVHSPPVLSPEQLEEMRLRLDAAALLFKVRVLSETLRDREVETPDHRTTT